MPTVTAHEFLYNNVINPVNIITNRSDITKDIMKRLGVTSRASENYNLVNTMYSDLYYYVYCNYKDSTGNVRYDYSTRGSFTLSNSDDEESLLALLNANTSTEYSTTGEWISNVISGTKGAYPLVGYEWDNTIYKDFDSE
jgi:hypothetical protein